MPLAAVERKNYIMNKLVEDGNIQVKNICDELGVSLPTVRSDLNSLEESGEIIRTFGGARLNRQDKKDDAHPYVNAVLSYSSRVSHNLESKKQAGKLASQLVSPFDSVFLDAGTTVYQMLEHIKDIDHLAVLTNSICVCTYLMECPRVSHYLVGGSVKPSSMATIGIKTIEDIRRHKVNKVFLGADGMSSDSFTVQDVNEAATKCAMIDIAAKRYLIIDSSKLNNPTFIEVAKLDVLDAIITENGIKYLKPDLYENDRHL